MSGATRWSRTLAVARKELLHVRRDAVLPRLIVLLPVMLLLLFGYALNTDVKNIRLAVVDGSHDRVSARIVRAYTDEHRFLPVPLPGPAALDAARAGRVRAILSIPPGALAAARAGQPVPYTLALDGSDPAFAAQIRAASAAATQDIMAALGAVRAARGTLSLPARPTLTTLYNPDNRSALYLVPGLSGLILTMICVMLTALSVVRERETGTIEALIATPVTPAEVVTGKLLPYFAFGTLDAALVLGLGHLLFGVPMRGSVALLGLAALLFVLGSLGLGLLISTVTRTQPQAMFATLAVMFPSVFLSGFLLPLEGLSRFFSAVSSLVPLRYYLSAVRGLMLRGAGWSELQGTFLGLAVFAVAALGLASLRFRKTL